MNDLKDRTLLVVADAHFRVGLAIFFCSFIITVFGLWSDFRHNVQKADEPAWLCGNAAMDKPSTDPVMRLGEKLFKSNCASCHKPDQKMTGPALKGAKERWARSGGDIYAWIKNSQAYLKSSGDAYARALFTEYGGSIMTPNAVSNEDIDAMLYYVDNLHRPVAVR